MIEKKFVLNKNNEKICVETYTPQNIRSTIVFCHGITGCRKGRTMEDSYFQDLANELMEKRFKVVLFDFSGHGESEGNDYDVCLSKSTSELSIVFDSEVEDKTNVSFLAFSYGATVLCNFLSKNKDIKPKKIVMYSPCLYPLEGCFLNRNSIFGKDIVKGYENGSLEKNKYVTVGAKNFRFGMKMIKECEKFSPDYLINFKDRIFVISGEDDVILDTDMNRIFCMSNLIRHVYVKASHSLFEDLERVFASTILYLY